MERREQELKHAIQSGLSRYKLAQAVEDFRAAKLSLLKAELYWTNNAKIRGRQVEERVEKLHNNLQRWAERLVDDILRDHAA